MSSEQSIDPNIVEQTKMQIRAVMNEIAQAAALDIAPAEFHADFLPRVVAAMAAVGGVVWTFDPQEGLGLSYQVNLKALSDQLDEETNKLHSRLLYKMLESSPEGTLVPPQSGAVEGEEESGNATECLLLFCPIRTELETVGLIEIFQRPDTNMAAQRGFLRFLSQACRIITDYYKARQLRHFGDRQSLWTLLEEFTRTIHRSLDVRETAFTIANEGRRLIGCDRVSLAVQRGRKCVIESISGQDMVDKRSTQVRLLGKLADAVVRSNEAIWYTGDTSDFAPQVEKCVDAYVDQSHTKLLAVYPLARKKPNESDEEIARHLKPEKPFAALIVEQIEDSRLGETLRRRSEIVAEHSASALGNALDHHNIFLMPLWKMIGKSKVLVSARMLPKTLTVGILLLATVLAMIFVPWSFRMHAKGKLEPVERKNIYSPLDAEVREVFVDHDTRVFGPKDGRPGTLLARLYSTELENTGLRLLGEEQEIDKQIASLDRQLTNEQQRLTPAEITQYQGQRAVAMTRMATNREQLRLFERQKQELEVRAPIDGTVVTWKVEEKLKSRPVARTQFLMEIANEKGAWQLELFMPEKSMGHIASYLAEKQRHDPGATLDVSFVLATDPNTTYRGVIEEFHDRAEVRSDSGTATGTAPGGINTVLIRVKLSDQETLPSSLRPGAECSAKVDCGTAPLGYVLLHELFAFVQKNIVFRLAP